MKGVICQLHSDRHGVYIGVSVNSVVLTPYIEIMESILGQQLSEMYVAKQKARDKDQHHITLINPFELRELGNASVANILDTCVAYEAVGTGRVFNYTDECFFVIIESPNMNNIRKKLGLPLRDLHVTIGFKTNDIHDVPKGRATLVTPS